VKTGQLLIAERTAQRVTLTSTNVGTVTLLLNDAMLNLDQPVVVCSGAQTLFSNRLSRSIATLAATLATRADSNLAFSASVTVKLPPPPIVRKAEMAED
jgi:hypothetical protein